MNCKRKAPTVRLRPYNYVSVVCTRIFYAYMPTYQQQKIQHVRLTQSHNRTPDKEESISQLFLIVAKSDECRHLRKPY